MALQYIGARYVPLFDGEYSSTKTYQPLTVVTYQNKAYTSRKVVPPGVQPTDVDYWALSGDYGAQLEHFEEQQQAFEQTITNQINAFETSVTQQIAGIQSSELADVTKYGAVVNSQTDSTAAFQAALNDTKYGGIFIPAGSFRINGTINITRSYVTVRADKAGMILNSNTTRTSPVFNITGTSVLVDSVTFTGPGNPTVYNDDTPFILVTSNSQLVHITNCMFRNFNGCGVKTGFSQDNLKNFGVNIQNCSFFQVNIGIHLTQSRYATIFNNIFYSNNQNCIIAENGCINVLIESNKLYGTCKQPIELGGTTNLNIQNNFFNVTNLLETEILFETANGSAQNTIISGNQFIKCDYAVYAEPAASNSVIDTIISNNIIEQNSNTDNHPMLLTGLDGKTLLSNNFYSNANLPPVLNVLNLPMIYTDIVYSQNISLVNVQPLLKCYYEIYNGVVTLYINIIIITKINAGSTVSISNDFIIKPLSSIYSLGLDNSQNPVLIEINSQGNIYIKPKEMLDTTSTVRGIISFNYYNQR